MLVTIFGTSIEVLPSFANVLRERSDHSPLNIGFLSVCLFPFSLFLYSEFDREVRNLLQLGSYLSQKKNTLSKSEIFS